MREQPDLLKSLVNKPQRESAGSDTASRFSYQKDWAFCQMLKMHMDGGAYLIAFEFHDDVVVLEPEVTPTSAHFCQVKTSGTEKSRSVSSLTSRRKTAPSILGKMWSNFEGICGSLDVAVVLVSNNAFDFSDKDICAKDLPSGIRSKIEEKLAQEVPHFAPKDMENLHFCVTGVAIPAMENYLHGTVLELFRQKFGESHGFNLHQWVRLIKGEITRKNDFPSSKIESVDDLVKKKCIASTSVEETLNTIRSASTKAFDIARMEKILVDAGWTQVEIIAADKAIPQVVSDRSDPANDELDEITERVRGFSRCDSGHLRPFDEYFRDVTSIHSKGGAEFNPYTQSSYLRALAVMVYHEEI